MRTNWNRFLLCSFLATAAGCASNEVPRPAPDMTAEVQELPLQQRYPLLQDSIDTTAREPVRASFNCSEQVISPLLDDVPPLDISFIEADVRDAILELSLMTGISIITDDSLEGMVSVTFAGKPLEEVLAAVISPGNFAYKVFDSFIYVGSQSPASPSFNLLSETCLYKPVFLQPAQIVDMLTPYHQQYVNYFEGHDYLSIVAPVAIQKRIQDDIKIFDQTPPQVLLEMSIIEVSEQALDMLGVKWNRRIQADEILARNESSTTALLAVGVARDSASPVVQALIDSASALETNEDMVIKAMPSMVTLNGREASFNSTRTSWLPVASVGGAMGQTNAVDYGVSLRIVPFVSEHNQIRLEILEASVSDLVDDLEGQPRLVAHGITTSVLMNDGETLVLGGLLQKKRRNQGNRVPGAERTPIMGGLFRQRESEWVDTEVLIVIRPQVLEG